MRPDLMMRSAIPVIMAGIVGLYGVIIDVFILGGSTDFRFNVKLTL